MGWLGRGSVSGCRSDEVASELSWRGDQIASAGELLGAGASAIRQQAVVPDAVEALGQDVHEEAANELARLQRHGFVPVRAFEAVVLVFERDAVRVGGDQAAVGDGDAMGVAGQVGEHLLWPLRTDAWHRRT